MNHRGDAYRQLATGRLACCQRSADAGTTLSFEQRQAGMPVATGGQDARAPRDSRVEYWILRIEETLPRGGHLCYL